MLVTCNLVALRRAMERIDRIKVTNPHLDWADEDVVWLPEGITLKAADGRLTVTARDGVDNCVVTCEVEGAEVAEPGSAELAPTIVCGLADGQVTIQSNTTRCKFRQGNVETLVLAKGGSAIESPSMADALASFRVSALQLRKLAARTSYAVAEPIDEEKKAIHCVWLYLHDNKLTAAGTNKHLLAAASIKLAERRETLAPIFAVIPLCAWRLIEQWEWPNGTRAELSITEKAVEVRWPGVRLFAERLALSPPNWQTLFQGNRQLHAVVPAADLSCAIAQASALRHNDVDVRAGAGMLTVVAASDRGSVEAQFAIGYQGEPFTARFNWQDLRPFLDRIDQRSNVTIKLDADGPLFLTANDYRCATMPFAPRPRLLVVHDED